MGEGRLTIEVDARQEEDQIDGEGGEGIEEKVAREVTRCDLAQVGGDLPRRQPDGREEGEADVGEEGEVHNCVEDEEGAAAAVNGGIALGLAAGLI